MSQNPTRLHARVSFFYQTVAHKTVPGLQFSRSKAHFVSATALHSSSPFGWSHMGPVNVTYGVSGCRETLAGSPGDWSKTSCTEYIKSERHCDDTTQCQNTSTNVIKPTFAAKIFTLGSNHRCGLCTSDVDKWHLSREWERRPTNHLQKLPVKQILQFLLSNSLQKMKLICFKWFIQKKFKECEKKAC